MKKILEAVIEFYQDTLNLQILEEGRPDVNKIAEECDTIQLGKLLRLILGCAINSDRKQEYIPKIMEMEELVQQNIMQAIQQLEEVTGGPGRSGLSLLILDTDTKIVRLVAELDAANEVKETLSQQCQQLEQQVQQLLEEKQTLIEENQDLKAKEALLEKGTRNTAERSKVEMLKEELFKVEVIRDDYKAKILEQEKQIAGYLEKIAELQVAASASSRLKDEVDALTESAGKVADMELALASYKKRLENYQILKNSIKKLEEENSEYLQKNLELEEEITRNTGWRNQCENYRSQLVELQQKLDEETQRADIAQFKIEKLEAKIVSLQGEKDRLLIERDSLRDENEELKCVQGKSDTEAAVAKELTPTEMKERLRFLEKEYKSLRAANQEFETRQAQYDSALNRIENLQQQNRNANQTILKLETQIEELKNTVEPSNNNNNSSIIKEYKQKILTLQESLSARDRDLNIVQSKYNRTLERAREVVQQLDMKNNTGNERIERLRELEERLMASAFYKLGLTCTREAMDERMAVLTGQTQSFLARQRQPTPRKQIPRFKSK